MNQPLLPLIRIIAAVDACGALGYNNTMAWHSPEEFKHFKTSTMGGVLIMGSNTFNSIGRPLPGRETIVVSRSAHPYGIPNQQSTNIVQAIAYAKEKWPDKSIWIAGGAQIYAQTLEQQLVDEIWLSRMPFQVDDADVYFPAMGSEWIEDEARRRPSYDANDTLVFTAHTYFRKNSHEHTI